MKSAIAQSSPGNVALRRLFKFDDVLDQARRKPKKTIAKGFMLKHGIERKNPPKTSSEYFERQWERERKHEEYQRQTNSWGKRITYQVNEAVESLEEQGLL